MSVSGPGKVISDGLVLYLDASNNKSIVSGNTTWFDVSRNGNNGTLTNGPTFNSAGYVVCDGTDDYIEVQTRNTNLEFQPNQPYSVFCWVYNLSGAGSGAIVSNMMALGVFQGWDLWVNNSTQISAHLISSWSGNAAKVNVNFDYTGNANKWVYMGYTYNGSCPANSTNTLNSMNFYFNGIVENSGKAVEADGFNSVSETISYNTSQRFRIASRWTSGALTQGGARTISSVQIYNRALSSSEILQNYNLEKKRFGL